MTLLVLHMDLAKKATSKAQELLSKKNIDTAWGANGLVGETAIKLLATDEFLISRDPMGRNKTPATLDEVSIASNWIMAGLCQDWPEKYGPYPVAA